MSNAQKPPKDLAQFIQSSAAIDFTDARAIKKRGDAKAVTLGLVDMLASKAQTSEAIPAPEYIRDPWHDFKQTLADAGESLDVYCNRSGVLVYTLTRDHLSSYLNGLAVYGESALGDQLQSRLLHAVATIRANTRLPQYALASADNMAHLRQTDPATFLLLAVQDALGRTQAANDPEWCEQLHRARVSLSAMPHGVVAYTTECILLFLRHIRPSTLGPKDAANLINHYDARFIDEICANEASLAHLCRRLLQTVFNFLQRYALRDLSAITTRDLARLRVHHQGAPIYKEMKAKEDAIRKARAEAVKAERRAKRDLAWADANLPPELADLPGMFTDDIEVVTVAAAFHATLGKPVNIAPQDEREAETFRAIADAASGDKPLFDAIFDLDSVDLIAIAEAQEPIDYDDPASVAAAGYIEEDEIEIFGAFMEEFTSDDDDDDSPPDVVDGRAMTPDAAIRAAKPIGPRLKLSRAAQSLPAELDNIFSEPSAPPPMPPTPAPARAPAKSGFRLALRKP